MLSESKRLLENVYRSKRMVNELGLGYEKIDTCPNHCMLYYKENIDNNIYLVCESPCLNQRVAILQVRMWLA